MSSEGRPREGSANEAIPLLDLAAHHADLRPALEAALREVLDEGRFVRGHEVEEFESAFARYCETKHAVGVANGTDALELVLEALLPEPGAECITVPTTFIAIAESIERVGGRVRFVDIDPCTWLMDAAHVAPAMTAETGVIVPVHLYGNPVDLDPIGALARGRDSVRVVEDAAQAHGARYREHRVGSLGDAACFSFYPGKNLGALGDGGAVVTSSDELAERVRLMSDHGRTTKYAHVVLGRNSRLDTIQAAVLATKLVSLDAENARRREFAQRYRQAFADLSDLRMPEPVAAAESVHHLFVIACSRRDALREFLAAEGVGTGIHYPIPLHLQPALRHLGHARGDFPAAERLASEIVSLPMSPMLDARQVDRVIDLVRRFFTAK